MSVKSHKPTLVGLMIDVSSSMGRNWSHHDGKELPKIQVIRDALNREVQKIKGLNSSRPKMKSVELFCIGMGFRRPIKKWQVVSTKNNREIPTGEIIQTHIDEAIVCDILALTEIIPTRRELQEIEEQICTKWSGYSLDILRKTNLRERPFDDLVVQIQGTLQATAFERLNNGIRGRLLKTLTNRSVFPNNKWLNRQTQNLQRWKLDKEKQVEFGASHEGFSYAEHMRQVAESIFRDYAQRYEKYVRATLGKFASQQGSRVFELLSLGYVPGLVFNAFDEEKAFGLAEQVYGRLEAEIRPKITRTWLSNSIRLNIAARAAGGSVDNRVVKSLTEELMQKVIWDRSRTFEDNLVIDIFKNAFKEKAKEWFCEWIDLSSSHEVTRSIKDIANILPDALEEEIYSGEFMFGATPIYDALKRVSLRFTDARYASHRKVLVIISDGEFEEHTVPYAARLLQKSGVTIINLCISTDQIDGKPAERDRRNWHTGVSMMFEMSSTADMSDSVSHALGRWEYQSEEGKRLFIQVNDSEALEDVLDAILINE